MKKLIILFFAIVASINIALADDGGTCGANLQWSYNSSTHALTITGTGAMTNWNVLSAPWDSYIEEITSISLPNGLTSIGNYAFYLCGGLMSVTIPNSVINIGKGAFSGCSGLVTITIPNSVTSIGDYAFYDVRNISYNGSAIGSPWGARSVNGYVDGYLVYSDANKSHLLACSSAATGTILIPNSVTNIGDNAFEGCIGLTSIIIPNSVTEIGDNAFNFCLGLTSVTIGNSVTSIGNGAFSSCSGLVTITIPNSVTEIGDYAFWQCNGLTNLTIGNSVMSIGKKAFSKCSSLTNVTIPNSVTSMEDNVFEECIGLASVTISNSVTSIGKSEFSKCSSLTSVTIPNSVTNIGDNAFEDCIGLTSVTIGNSVTDIGANTFYRCTNLTNVAIGNNVTSIGDNAFYDCYRLAKLQLPSSVAWIGNNAFYGVLLLIYDGTATGSPWGASYIAKVLDGYLAYADYEKTEIVKCLSDVSGSITIPESVLWIRERAFAGLTNITNLTILGLTHTIPETILPYIDDYAFAGCTGLTSIDIPNAVKYIGTNAFNNVNNIVYNGTATGSPWGAKCINGYVEDGLVYTDITKTTLCGCSSTVTGTIIIPNSVTSIKDYAFYNCTGLTSVTIPNSVISIGKWAFYGCTRLSTLRIPNSVTNVGYNAFYDVPLVVYGGDATGSPWGARKVAKIVDGYLAYADFEKTNLVGCLPSATGSISIPNSVTTISNRAFQNCTGITSVTIPNSVTSIGQAAFSGCTGLTSVNIPENVTTISDFAFDSCTGLTSVTIPNSVTSIGSYAFYGCIGLTSINIPDNVTVIGVEAFENCIGITNATIGSGILRIEDYAFYNCTGLENVTISMSDGANNVRRYIGVGAFAGCIKLKNIIIPNTNTLIDRSAFEHCTGLEEVIVMKGTILSFAFKGCSHLKKLYLGNDVGFVRAPDVDENGIYYAYSDMDMQTFDGCFELMDIFCYRYIPEAFYGDDPFTSVDKTLCTLHVPASSLTSYRNASIWEEFFNIVPIEAENTTTSDCHVVPGYNSVDVYWPYVNDAFTFELLLYDCNGNVVWSLEFNVNGQLRSPALYAVNTTQNGYKYNIVGLDNGGNYHIVVNALGRNGNVLQTFSQNFTTGATALEDVNADGASGVRKVIEDGKVVIVMPDGRKFDASGKRLK